MGLFSRPSLSRPSIPSPLSLTGSDDKIYVFLRTSNVSSQDIEWSIAVSHTQSPYMSGLPTPPATSSKPRKSFLSIRSRNSSKSSIQFDPQVTEEFAGPRRCEITEFAHDSGNLNINVHRSSRSPIVLNEDCDSLLLQILLPQPLYGSSSTQPLTLQVEQCLHRITSASFHLGDGGSECWLKLALIALQTHKIIAPTIAGLNVEKFLEQAANSFTGFEGEILNDGGAVMDDNVIPNVEWGARYVKMVDYAAHMHESERLRGLLERVKDDRGRRPTVFTPPEHTEEDIWGPSHSRANSRGVGYFPNFSPELADNESLWGRQRQTGLYEMLV